MTQVQGDSGLFKALRAEVSAEWTAASSKRGSCRPRWVARVASRVDRTGGFDAGFRIEGFGLPARKLGGGADDVKHKNSTETMSDALEVTSDRLRLRVHLGSGYRRCGRNNGAIHF